jgi:hypothetical protein
MTIDRSEAAPFRSKPTLYRWPRTDSVDIVSMGVQGERAIACGSDAMTDLEPSRGVALLLDELRLRLGAGLDSVRRAAGRPPARETVMQLQEAIDHLAADIDAGFEAIGGTIHRVDQRDNPVGGIPKARLVMHRLGLERLVIARLLLSLIDHPGQLYVPARMTDGRIDRGATKRSRVYISMLRRALRSHGFEQSIETIGGGYRISEEMAGQIAALWEHPGSEAR